MIKHCKFCQVEFSSDDVRKVFCTQKCGARDSKKRLRAAGRCPLCAEETLVNPKTGKKYYYCEKHRDCVREERNCAVCERKFMVHDARQKYCSKNCSSLAADARKRSAGLCKICSKPAGTNPKTGRRFYLCEEHRNERNDRGVEYYHGHKDAFKRRTYAYVEGLKRKFFEMYGAKCSCCSDDRQIFLTLDHVKGDGAQHRKKCNTPWNAYRDAVLAFEPSKFQVLCANCNFAKRTAGACPCGGKSYRSVQDV